MGSIDALIQYGREKKASDIHLTVGKAPVVRINGSLSDALEYEPLSEEQVCQYADEMLKVSVPEKKAGTIEEIDFCYETMDGTRNRVNVYRQKKQTAIAIRLLSNRIPKLQELGLPQVVSDLCMLKRGMVLVTGPTGSGKSTTLAAMIGQMNAARNEHVITIEDPIEYVHGHHNCMIHQRELETDTESFSAALRGALREDPDIIQVGEMRDFETIASALTAAETGHLLLSTLHTTGAAQTIDRVIDVFPPYQQQQVRTQLASVLKAVISQQLVPTADGKGRVAALEILFVTDAVANLIRESKCNQIASVLQTGAKLGMQSMDGHLCELVKRHMILPETAVDYGIDKNMLMKKLFS